MRPRRPPLEDVVLDDAIEYFSSAFPNPHHEGCPEPDRLRAAARGTDVVSGDLRAHLLQCSECLREFRQQRLQTGRAGTVIPSTAPPRHGTWLLAAASILLVSGLAATLGLWRTFEPAEREPGNGTTGGPQSVAGSREVAAGAVVEDKVVSIKLMERFVQRGTAESDESAARPLSIPAGQVRFEIELPAAYPEGEYEIAIVDGFDEAVREVKARASNQRLAASLDATGLAAGRLFLRVGRSGQPHDYLPVVVEPAPAR